MIFMNAGWNMERITCFQNVQKISRTKKQVFMYMNIVPTAGKAR